MDNRTEQLATGVWRVEVGFSCNAYVCAVDGRGDGEGLVVVDTGTLRGGPRLVRSIRMLGFDPHAVDLVLCTHWHADHTGSAERFARSSANPVVHAPADDLDIVHGAPPPPPDRDRSTRLGRLLAPRLPRPRACPEARPLRPGDRFDATGGLVAVAAPGHTRGHTALWLGERGVLLAGDALTTLPRPWLGPRSLHADVPAARGSLRRLAALSPAVVAVGHGPPLRRRAEERLAAIAG